MATDSEEEARGLGWTFGSYVFEKAFAKLATSLRWMFWGLLLQLFGLAIAGAPLTAVMFRLGKPNVALVLPGLIVMVVGGIVLLIGEQKCLHLELPLGMTRSLPGHYWLRAAYWCHLGSWLLRMARRLVGPRMALLLLPLQLLGFAFLLLFLRKTADVLARRDLKRLVDVIFGLAGATFFIGGLLTAELFLKWGILKPFPPLARMTFLAAPVLLFLLTTGAYVILLGRMAAAAATFAKYLATVEEPGAAKAKEMLHLADKAFGTSCDD